MQFTFLYHGIFVLSQSIVWKCFKLLYKVSIKIERKKKKKANQTDQPTRTEICAADLEYLTFCKPCVPVGKDNSHFSCLFRRPSLLGSLKAQGEHQDPKSWEFGHWCWEVGLGWTGLGSGHKTGVKPPLAEESAWKLCKIPYFFCFSL